MPLCTKVQFPNNSGKSLDGRRLKAVVNKTFHNNAAITVLRNILLDKRGCNFSIVNPTRFTIVSILFYFWNDTICVGRSFRPSSAVKDCTYNNRHLSNRYRCLLEGGYPLASRQRYLFRCCMYSLKLLMKDRPKHIECHSKNKINLIQWCI